MFDLWQVRWEMEAWRETTSVRFIPQYVNDVDNNGDPNLQWSVSIIQAIRVRVTPHTLYSTLHYETEHISDSQRHPNFHVASELWFAYCVSGKIFADVVGNIVSWCAFVFAVYNRLCTTDGGTIVNNALERN